MPLSYVHLYFYLTSNELYIYTFCVDELENVQCTYLKELYMRANSKQAHGVFVYILVIPSCNVTLCGLE